MINIRLLGSDLVGKARQCVRVSSLNGCPSLKKVTCGLGNEDLSIEWSLVAQHPHSKQGLVMGIHLTFIAGGGQRPASTSPQMKLSTQCFEHGHHFQSCPVHLDSRCPNRLDMRGIIKSWLIEEKAQRSLEKHCLD